MDDWKKASSLNLSRRWRFPLFPPRSLSSAWFYVEIRPFLSEMPETCSAAPFTVQILRIREQQEKNREKTAREASKRRESDSLTEDGKLYRCHSFNSIFYLQKSYFKLFFRKKKYFFLLTQSRRSQRIFLRRPSKFHPKEKFKHVWTEHVGMAEEIRLKISSYFGSSFWRN